ncbi:MAG TPA: hypothetical protein VND90_09975 [Terracidiphilus sp.]|nr:hypothetical protein [Terracidiphilus sp.]
MSESPKSESRAPRREPTILPPEPPPDPTPNRQSVPEPDDPPSQGPSLVLLYSILGIVLLISMFIAALIVRPFYLRR